jgi:hypothetical protein
MRENIMKILNLMSAPHRIERAHALSEIRLNHFFFKHETAGMDAITFDQFLAQLNLNDSPLFDLLKSGGEAEEAVQWIRLTFQKLAGEKTSLPFPTFYNADKSFALLTYALASYLKPELVLETGVGYGITSALVLSALVRNNMGKLVSIDLPPLSDPHGSCTGIAVPEYLRENRWILHFGSSRRCLPIILADIGKIDLFVSDSANIYTLQQYEFKAIYTKLSVGGAAIFNNIGPRFQTFLTSINDIEFYSIVQVEKSSCITGLVLKMR